MSLSSMARRLSALERTVTPTETVCVWLQDGETAEKAIAHRFPEGVPANLRVNLYRWASTPAEAADSK
jgi:hypothetical protein